MTSLSLCPDRVPRVEPTLSRFPVRFPNRSIWAVPVLAFSLALSACGDDSGSNEAPAENPEIVEAVTKKIGVAAAEVIKDTPDRNLPGPYFYKTVCLTPEEAAVFSTPRESVQCHIEMFTEATGGRKSAYVWSEDWRVPIVDGKPAGEPEIVGEYRIKNYLRRDNRLNCSGGKTPQERCTGLFKAPPEQSGIQGGSPPAGAQPTVPTSP